MFYRFSCRETSLFLFDNLSREKIRSNFRAETHSGGAKCFSRGEMRLYGAESSSPQLRNTYFPNEAYLARRDALSLTVTLSSSLCRARSEMAGGSGSLFGILTC